MFHLYFGALDVCLYAAAFFVSLALSRALCESDAALQPAFQTVSASTAITQSSFASAVQPTAQFNAFGCFDSVVPVHPATTAVALQTDSTPLVQDTTTAQVSDKPRPIGSSFENSHTDSSLVDQWLIEPVTELAMEVVQKDYKEDNQDKRPVLDLSKTRLYKLRKQSVIKLKDLSFTIPETIKQYMLRGEPVVYLHTLENFVEVVT